jgi:hypothetical protein
MNMMMVMVLLLLLLVIVRRRGWLLLVMMMMMMNMVVMIVIVCLGVLIVFTVLVEGDYPQVLVQPHNRRRCLMIAFGRWCSVVGSRVCWPSGTR